MSVNSCKYKSGLKPWSIIKFGLHVGNFWDLYGRAYAWKTWTAAVKGRMDLTSKICSSKSTHCFQLADLSEIQKRVATFQYSYMIFAENRAQDTLDLGKAAVFFFRLNAHSTNTSGSDWVLGWLYTWWRKSFT